MLTWSLPNNLNFYTHKQDDLTPLFLSGMVRRMAVILLSLFSPVYIFKIARSFGVEERFAVLAVIIFYLVALLTKLVSLSAAENLSQKLGFKRMIWISALPLIIFIFGIIYASKMLVFLFFSAIFWGIHTGFFWWGYHGYFVKAGDEKRFGQSIAEAGFLETVAAIATPFLGSLIASLLGLEALFVLVGLLIILALVILGKDYDKKQKRDVKFMDVLSLIKSHKSVSLAYAGSSAESIVYVVIWPVFLFLFFQKIISLGAIVSLAILGAAIFTFLVGRWVDKQGEREVIMIGIPFVFISWILRLIKRSMPFFIIADSFWVFGQRMVALPLNVLSYKKAKEGGTGRAVLFREVALIIGSVASLLLLSVWIVLEGELMGAFLIPAFFSLLPSVAILKKRI